MLYMCNVCSDEEHEMSYVSDGKGGHGAIRLRRLRKPTSDDDKTRKQVCHISMQS